VGHRRDIRVQTQQHADLSSGSRRSCGENIQLSRVIHHHARHTELQRTRDLGGRLRVSVHEDSRGFQPRAPCDLELSGGDHIHPPTGLPKLRGERPAEKRLRGIDKGGIRPESLAVLVEARLHVRLVHDVCGSTEVGGQGGQLDPADAGPAVLRAPRVGQYARQIHPGGPRPRQLSD
jgi:hypothetical protein